MTRRETTILKGVAILFMVWLHLFNHVDNYTSLFMLDGVPLPHFLSRATNPVAFFLLLSGYGLYAVHQKGDKHRFSRILKLFVHFWIILVVFVSIGSYVKPDRYPGSFTEFFYNFFALNTSYNGEWWFLFPYTLLAITSKYLFELTQKIKARYIILGTYILSLVTGFIISRYGQDYLYNNHLLYNPFLYFHLLPAFMWGAMLKRCDIIARFKCFIEERSIKAIFLWIALAALFLTFCAIGHTAFHIIFVTAFAVIFVVAHRWKLFDQILEHLGKHSMNVWLIHTFFCYYLFHDLIYSLRWPIVIFAITLLLSLTCSYAIDIIAKPITKRIK